MNSNHLERGPAVHKYQRLHDDDKEASSRSQCSSRKIANNGGHGGATAADDSDAKNQRYRQDYRSRNDWKERIVDNSQDLRPQRQSSFGVSTTSNQTHRIDTATSTGQKRGATYENEQRFDSTEFHRSADERGVTHNPRKISKIEARDRAEQIEFSRPTEDKGSNRSHFTTEYTRTNTRFLGCKTATAQQPHPSSSSTLSPLSRRMVVDVNTSGTAIGDGGNHSSSSNNGGPSTTAQSNYKHIANVKNMFNNINANGIENVMNKLASNQPHAIPTQSVEQLIHLDKLYMNSCWSLISRLDKEMYAKQFKLNSEEVNTMGELVSQIMATLSNLHDFLKRLNIDTKFELDKNTVRQVQFDEPSENEWDDMILINKIDSFLCILCMPMVDNDKTLEETLKKGIFCSINNILHDRHLDYLGSKMFQNISALRHGNDGGTAAGAAANTVRIKLCSLLFVSLRKDISMSWIDVNYQLQEVLKKNVHKLFDAEKIAKDTTSIYVNISMSKDTKHFRILSKRTTPANRFMSTFMGSNNDGDGLLALVQLASMNFDPTKNVITFKAFVVNTISANNFNCKR